MSPVRNPRYFPKTILLNADEHPGFSLDGGGGAANEGRQADGDGGSLPQGAHSGCKDVGCNRL